MREHLRLLAAGHGGDVREDARTRHGRRTHGRVLQILQGLNAVLRSLGNEVIVDAVLPIQKESRCSLEAAAQGDQQAAGDVPRGEATLGCLRAVYGNVEFGVIEVLLYA